MAEEDVSINKFLRHLVTVTRIYCEERSEVIEVLDEDINIFKFYTSGYPKPFPSHISVMTEYQINGLIVRVPTFGHNY